MPTIKFRMLASYQERIDDILLSYNDGKEKDQQFDDISQWEHLQIRQFLSDKTTGFIGLFRSWETNGKIMNIVTGQVIPAALELNYEVQFEAEQEDEKARPYLRALTLSAMYVKWLQRVSAYNYAVTRFLNDFNKTQNPEILHPISHIISDVLETASWRAVVSLDVIELDEDDKQTKKAITNKKGVEQVVVAEEKAE
jgi:hypothetical protein